MTVGLKSRALAVRLVVLSLVAMGWFAGSSDLSGEWVRGEVVGGLQNRG